MSNEINKAIYSIGTKAYLDKEAKEMSEQAKTQLKQNGLIGINPLGAGFAAAPMNRRILLGMMFLPDRSELLILLSSFIFNILVLGPLLQFNISLEESPSNS